MMIEDNFTRADSVNSLGAPLNGEPIKVELPLVFSGRSRQGLISAITPRIARAEGWPVDKVRTVLEAAFPPEFDGYGLARVMRKLVNRPWGSRAQARRRRKGAK